MTPLSGNGPLLAETGPAFGLARASLLALVLMSLASGCIVADPPQYSDPLQTPPVLDLYLANPSTQKVVIAKTGDMVQFTVPVRSEDAAENLTAQLYVDGTFRTYLTIPPSTFNVLGREVRMIWTAGATLAGGAGCHIVTIIVAHESTFISGAGGQIELDAKKAKDDAATITWWVNLDAAEDMQTTLKNCPTLTVHSQ